MVNKIFTPKDQLNLLFDTLDIEYNISVSKTNISEKSEINQIILSENKILNVSQNHTNDTLKLNEIKSNYLLYKNIYNKYDIDYIKEKASPCDIFLLKDYNKIWSKEFPDIFFDLSWKIFLDKERPTNHRSHFVIAQVIRKHIYSNLGVHSHNLTYGELLKELDKKNIDRKFRHHQCLNEVGIRELRKQINIFINIAKLFLNNKEGFIKEYDKQCKISNLS